jgi:hypothetical protein
LAAGTGKFSKISSPIGELSAPQRLNRLAGQTRLDPNRHKMPTCRVLLRTIGIGINETALRHGCIGDKNLAAIEQDSDRRLFSPPSAAGNVGSGIASVMRSNRSSRLKATAE